jgi:hypothetical protein
MHSIATRKKIGDALFRGIDYLCDYCNMPARSSKSHYEKKTRHFCSQYCYSMFRKEVLPKWEQNRFGTGNTPEERAKRVKARSDLNHAIRDGKLERPDYCFIDSCHNKPEAHHDDYDRPLEVHWLCFKHHRAHHKSIYENKELLR